MNDDTRIRDAIEHKLADGIPDLSHLEVINESHRHNVPPGSESHFKVVLVAGSFASARLLERHRRVNALLADELAGPVHALAIHAWTPDEWRARMGDTPQSPPCLGGGRRSQRAPDP